MTYHLVSSVGGVRSCLPATERTNWAEQDGADGPLATILMRVVTHRSDMATSDRDDYDTFEEWIAAVAAEEEVAPEAFQRIVEGLGDGEPSSEERRLRDP